MERCICCPKELGDVSDMFPRRATSAPQQRTTQCDDVASNCFHEHAYGFSNLECSNAATIQGHARTAWRGWRSLPAASAWRWTPAASPGSKSKPPVKHMPDHKLGPGNRKFSSQSDVTNMCTKTDLLPVRGSPAVSSSGVMSHVQE